MAVLRVQSILKSVTGMVRDNCVNTWHFEGLITPANLQAIDTAVDRFYRATISGQARSVDVWLGTQVSALTNKIYDVTEEPAGAPILVSPERVLVGTRFGTKGNMPSEAAVCLSFAGTPEVGLVQSRRRGRVFIGPLRYDALEYVGGDMRPISDFRTDLIMAAQRMATEVDGTAEWVVYSRPFAGRGEIVRPGRSTLPAIPARPGTTVNIDEVSVDNAVDTQRRRGTRPTLRQTAMTGE